MPPRVTVVQEGADLPDPCAVTADQAFSGSNSLALKLDPDAMSPYDDDGLWDTCRLKLTLHGVEAEPGQYLGLSFYGPGLVWVPYCFWPGQEGRYWVQGEWMNGGGAWASIWMEVPDGAANPETGEPSVELLLIVEHGADTLWIDSVRLGSGKAPYQYESGTSMACPLVAGAAAVLAAQTGKTGVDLAELVKTTVRQTDGLKDMLVSGGVLDFDASGNISPDRDPAPVYPLYDTSLPLDIGAGAPFVFDAGGDRETRGPLTGLDGRLYYLPLVTQVEEEPGSKPFLAFDPETKTWETLPELPLWMDQVSAAAFDGKLAVKGTAMSVDPATGVPTHDEAGAVCVCVYDPAARVWSQASTEGVLAGQTLFACGGGLALLGSDGMDPAVLADYDPETGAASGQALNTWFAHPQAAEKDGAVYLFDVSDYSLTRITADGEENLTDALPAYRATHPDDYYSEPEMTERWGVLLTCDEGLLLVGVLSEDGAADTWLLRDGADKFEPLLRKTCNTRPFSVAAGILNGRVYAIGAVWNEEIPRFFRANDLATLNDPVPEPTPGPSGGGGGGAAANPVNVPASAATTGGTVKSSAANALAGDKVTLTLTPDEGYVTAGVTVTDKNGNEVPVTKNADGTYSFTMPATAVTITPEFEEIQQPSGGDVSDRFTDVPGTAWYHDAVQWAVDQGIMNGVSDTRFAPNDTTTRAMVVTMLWRLAGEPAAQSPAPFADVKDGAWYADSVAWAAETGAVNGTSDTTFSPDEPVTREQLAAILYRYAQAQGKGYEGAWRFLLDYPDAADVSEWADEAMHWMVMHGVITGMGDGTLAPQANATRAQIATMFMRFAAEMAQ